MEDIFFVKKGVRGNKTKNKHFTYIWHLFYYLYIFIHKITVNDEKSLEKLSFIKIYSLAAEFVVEKFFFIIIRGYFYVDMQLIWVIFLDLSFSFIFIVYKIKNIIRKS